MPRLRSAQGVVVNVSDDKAARLGSGWVAAEESAPAPTEKAAPKRSAAKK